MADTHGVVPSRVKTREIRAQRCRAFAKFLMTSSQSSSDDDNLRPRYRNALTESRGIPLTVKTTSSAFLDSLCAARLRLSSCPRRQQSVERCPPASVLVGINMSHSSQRGRGPSSMIVIRSCEMFVHEMPTEIPMVVRSARSSWYRTRDRWCSRGGSHLIRIRLFHIFHHGKWAVHHWGLDRPMDLP
jgi:hypothetical protein